MDSASRDRGAASSLSPKLAQASGASQNTLSECTQQLTEKLRDCDWEQLEERYAKAMEEHGKSEEELRDQISKLLEVNFQYSYP